jgi:hypothetical protein
MKSLFDENHRYTDAAITLDSEFNKNIEELYKKYIDMGYSPREISHVMQLALFDTEMCYILRK